MGEIRKPGGGRKKLKPKYDAGKNLKEQMDAAVSLYKNKSLQAIADTLSLNPIKVRKLLITAEVYESDIAETVHHTFHKYRETQSYKDAILSTASEFKLSKASVTSYLPYSKLTLAYHSLMKHGKTGTVSTQKSCGSTGGRRVKVWRGVLCCWLWAILKR